MRRKSSPTRERERDARVEDHGTIWLVWPLTDCGRAWLRENVADDATWFGSALAVEPRYVDDLVAGMREAGLVVGSA